MCEHSIPVIPSESHSILDIGCGDGESLQDAQLMPGSLSAGVDINLRLTESLPPEASLVALHFCLRGPACLL